MMRKIIFLVLPFFISAIIKAGCSCGSCCSGSCKPSNKSSNNRSSSSHRGLGILRNPVKSLRKNIDEDEKSIADLLKEQHERLNDSSELCDNENCSSCLDEAGCAELDQKKLEENIKDEKELV